MRIRAFLASLLALLCVGGCDRAHDLPLAPRRSARPSSTLTVGAPRRDDVPPSAQIVSPEPYEPGSPSPGIDDPGIVVPTTLRVTWRPGDADDVPGDRLTRYKYRLFSFDTRSILYWYRPESILADFGPSFAGWDSVPGESLGHTLSLTARQQYVFVLVGFDARGACSPVFSHTNNLLLLTAREAGVYGPRFNVFADGFRYSFPTGGIPLHDTLSLQAPMGRPFPIHWSGDPMLHSHVMGYRWSLDRPGRSTGPWSPWSPQNTTASVAPAGGPGASRTLTIEAYDNLGWLSRIGVTVSFTNVHPDRGQRASP
jgi:hypothetical protein